MHRNEWFEQKRQEFLAQYKNVNNSARKLINSSLFIEYLKEHMSKSNWNKCKAIIDPKEAHLPHHKQANYNKEQAHDARRKFSLRRYEFMYGKLKCKHCGATEGDIFDKLRQATSIRILTRYDYCSDSCSKKNEHAYNARVTTVRKKYGVDNVSRVPAVIKKIKQKTCTKEALQRRQQKTEETIIAKYGSLDTYYKLMAKKRLPTIQKRYGGNAATCSEKVKAKVRATLMKHYGVTTPMHSPEIFAKLQNTLKYKHKDVTVAGKLFKNTQGYEEYFLNWFHKHAKNNTIKDIFSNCTRFSYKYNGKEHSYFPDFIIPKKGIIIEVKSTYTMGLERNTYHYSYTQCRAKSYAVIKHGFYYKFVVCFPEQDKVFIHTGKLPPKAEMKKILNTWMQKHLGFSLP